MLIKTNTEIKNFIPVSVAAEYDTLKPFITAAEADYIKTLLGASMYDELVEFYNSDNWPLAEDAEAVLVAMGELLEKVQLALINLAYWVGFDELNSFISDNGFHRTESESMKGLYRYQEDSLRDSFKNKGFNALDSVLEYLEENIAHFEEFKASDNYTLLKNAIIPKTSVFDNIYFIGGSRLVFLRLKRFMQICEDFDLLPVIGSKLMSEVKTEIVKNEPAPRITTLLPYLRKPLAFLTIATAIDELAVDISDKGLLFNKAATNSPSMRRDQLPDERITLIARRARDNAQRYIDLLKDFLTANAEIYTEYSGGESTGRAINRDNTSKKTIFLG